MDVSKLGLEAPGNVAGLAYRTIYAALEQVAATGASLQDLTNLLEEFEEKSLQIWHRLAPMADAEEVAAATVRGEFITITIPTAKAATL